jgi:hypothetical protein
MCRFAPEPENDFQYDNNFMHYKQSMIKPSPQKVFKIININYDVQIGGYDHSETFKINNIHLLKVLKCIKPSN